MSDSNSQPSSRTSRTTIFSGKFELLLRAIKHSDIHLEVPSLKSRKSFEYFFCFHQTLGISPKDLKGFKADIAFIYTALACPRAISTNLNFDLTFVTRNFIGLCIIRCAFWLVSGKDDCLERVLGKSFCIKKLIGELILRNILRKYRKLFSCVCIAWYKHSRGWENSLGEFSTVMQTLDFVSGLHDCL